MISHRNKSTSSEEIAEERQSSSVEDTNEAIENVESFSDEHEVSENNGSKEVTKDVKKAEVAITISDGERASDKSNADTNDNNQDVEVHLVNNENDSNKNQSNKKSEPEKKSNFKSKKQKRIIQTLILISICVLYGAQGGTIDAPAALQEQIMTELNVDAFTYQLLYSLYSFPNIILVFIGGIVVDSILGLRTSGIVYTGVLFLGQFIMAIGAFTKIFPLMVVGRFIYGIGGESFQIVTQKYIVKWFRGRMMNIAFGIAFAFYRVTGFIQLNVNQAIYETLRQKYNFSGPNAIGLSFMVGVAGIFIGLIFSVILFIFDKKYQHRDSESQTGTFKQLIKDLKGIVKFDPNFYILCICLIFFSIGSFPFGQLAQGFYISKYLLSSSQAIFTLSISSIVGTIASPIFGIIVGLVGYDLYIQYFIYAVEILIHAGYAFTFITPTALIVFSGIAGSIFNCVYWPIPAHIISEDQLGIAYGVMLCLQNLGLAIVPLVTGKIVDNSGYLLFEFHILFFLSITAVLATILLYTDVLISSGKLNQSAKKRAKAKK